jgi:hypothetical protein
VTSAILDPPHAGLDRMAKFYYDNVIGPTFVPARVTISSTGAVLGYSGSPGAVAAALPKGTEVRQAAGDVAYIRDPPSEDAKKRAIQLRRELLSPEDSAALESPAGLSIPSKIWPNREYRVYSHHQTVMVFDNGRFNGRLELSGITRVPLGDEHLAEILMLRLREREAVRVAWYQPPWWR